MNATAPANLVPLPTSRIPDRRARANRPQPKQRFHIQEFTNPSGAIVWRVTGIKRDGARIRENYTDPVAAQTRQAEFETQYLARTVEDQTLRTTRLSEPQLRIAETMFPLLERDEDLVIAVTQFLKQGRQTEIESPRLDAAAEQFKTWLDSTPTLRARTKVNLKLRVTMFANGTGNHRVADIRPEHIEEYLGKRGNVSATTKDNDRRCISRFFRWCIDRPRRWTLTNPCREVRIERNADKAAPVVLTVKECKAIMSAAKAHRKGRLVPYFSLCLFGALRPFEAARISWSQINLADGEIRIEASQSKVKRARTVTIGPTLKAWLESCKGRPIFPKNFRKDFDAVKLAAGFAGRATASDGLKPWKEDVLRHTGISHHFRNGGSYGLTAEWAGNSETIIKQFYQGRVTSEDTAKFYALRPTKTKGGKR